MTKIRLLLFLSLFFCFPNVYADTTWTYKKKNSFFIEAGGKGPDYSINYSRIFKQGRKLIYSWRAGFSLLAHDLSFPIAVTAFTKRAPHHLEFSLGLTPYIKGYKTFLHKNDLSDKQFYITPSIGYRYQKINGIFFYQRDWILLFLQIRHQVISGILPLNLNKVPTWLWVFFFSIEYSFPFFTTHTIRSHF